MDLEGIGPDPNEICLEFSWDNLGKPQIFSTWIATEPVED
jgi:hypothetical protein